MSEQVSDREVLSELAAKPIGSPELQAEAERIAHIPPEARPVMSPELKETAKRANKIWLPQGKRSAVEANRTAAKRCAEAQTDIEGAVEAAGGARGGGHKFA